MNYPWHLNHVLALSRSYLPVNVAPARRGGAATYPGRLSNYEIAAWVRDQVAELLVGRRRSILQRLRDVVLPGASNAGHGPWSDVDVFISYRGSDLEAARRLKAELEAGRHHAGRKQEVVLFGPGELAHPTAVLPPILRWNVLSIISDIVHSCSEMWIVDNEKYLQSWWTQGELVCCRYFGGDVRIVVWSPETGEVTNAPTRFMTALSVEQQRQMSRAFANSHPNIIGAESVEAMRQLRSTGLQYAADEVFAERFWTVPLLECKQCSFRDDNPFGTPGPVVPQRLDPETFLTNRLPQLYRVELATLEELAGDHTKLQCPGGCSGTFAIDALPPAYFHYQLPVGPSGSHLESVPVYSATPSPRPNDGT